MATETAEEDLTGRRLRQPVAGFALWTAAAAFASMLAPGGTADNQLVWVSLVSSVLGLAGFYRIGGRVITGPGVLCLGHAIMVGFAGIYIGRVGFEDNDYPSLLRAAWVLFMAQNVLIHMFWYKWAPAPRPEPSPEKTVPIVFSGVLLTAVGTWAMSQVGTGSDYSVDASYLIAEGTQAAGFVCLTAWAAQSFRSPFPAYAVTLAASLVALSGHTGGGRLRLAVLAAAMTAAIAFYRQETRVKLLAIIAAPVAMVVLARQRVEYSASQGVTESTGFESLVSPLHAVGKILSTLDHGGLPLQHGRTFFTPLQTIFPDLIPGTRPFGYEIATYTRPHIRNPDYSEAGHIVGEFIYNFGWLGIPAGVLVLGILVPRLFDWAQRSLLLEHNGLFVAAWALGVGTMLELEWGGLHTAALRFSTRLAALLVVAVLLQLMLRASPTRTTDTSTQQGTSLPTPKGQVSGASVWQRSTT